MMAKKQINELDTTTQLTENDLLVVDVKNNDETYTTKNVNFQTLATSAIENSQIATDISDIKTSCNTIKAQAKCCLTGNATAVINRKSSFTFGTDAYVFFVTDGQCSFGGMPINDTGILKNHGFYVKKGFTITMTGALWLPSFYYWSLS